ncbi:MAG: GNAT family N-acetyltransferase [Bacteroidota bacterium]
MIDIVRTNSDDLHFISLVRCLDADLAERDGAEHSFYAQFNKVDNIKYAIVAYEDGLHVGCGAIKEHDVNTMEVKRIYILPAYRGKGIAKRVLTALEEWTIELNHSVCILETGKNQPEAIGLYNKAGYSLIPNYGQYAGIVNSVCFKKLVKSETV